MSKEIDFKKIMSRAPRVRLGDYIEQTDERNIEGKYVSQDVRGISNLKTIIPTKANMEGVPLHSYKILNHNEFCYVTVTSRNGNKISLGINKDADPYIFSSTYITFRCKDINELDPGYLYIILSREEFDRYSRFNSWGSARETFDWSEMQRVEIPLPAIEVQREIVATYEGLKNIAEENEALLEPLQAACHAYIVDCMDKYPHKELGEFITQRREKNNGLNVPIKGVTREGFIEPKQKDADTSKYNVFYKYDFVFNPARMEINSIALNLNIETGICSSLYEVFYINSTETLNPVFLNLFIKRDEFARQCEYIGFGSAREYCRVNNISSIKIPLPPIEVQEAIVSIYHCMEEAKSIARDARELMKTICPALIQKAANCN